MEIRDVSDYSINGETMALKTCAVHPEMTVVYERKQMIRVRGRAINFIKKACIEDGWADYAGRRTAVKHHMQYHYKIPIPVIPDLNLFFFPTHGEMNEDNIWLNPDTIRWCDKGELPVTSDVEFINETKLNVLLQMSTLHALYIRALRCQNRFKGPDPFHFV